MAVVYELMILYLLEEDFGYATLCFWCLAFARGKDEHNMFEDEGYDRRRWEGRSEMKWDN